MLHLKKTVMILCMLLLLCSCTKVATDDSSSAESEETSKAETTETLTDQDYLSMLGQDYDDLVEQLRVRNIDCPTREEIMAGPMNAPKHTETLFGKEFTVDMDFAGFEPVVLLGYQKTLAVDDADKEEAYAVIDQLVESLTEQYGKPIQVDAETRLQSDGQRIRVESRTWMVDEEKNVVLYLTSGRTDGDSDLKYNVTLRLQEDYDSQE